MTATQWVLVVVLLLIALGVALLLLFKPPFWRRLVRRSERASDRRASYMEQARSALGEKRFDRLMWLLATSLVVGNGAGVGYELSEDVEQLGFLALVLASLAVFAYAFLTIRAARQRFLSGRQDSEAAP